MDVSEELKSISDISLSSHDESKDASMNSEKNEIGPRKDFEFDKIECILKSCKPDLSMFLDRFKNAFVVNEAIENLTMENVKDIFRNEVGLREIFWKTLNEARGTCEDSKIIEMKPKTYREFKKWKKEKISSILKMYNPELAETIMTYYKEQDSLTCQFRKEISNILVRYFIHNRIWLSRDDFPVLTKLIVREFPDEDPLFYFTPVGYKQNKNPSGVLYSRYVNQTTTWRQKLCGVYKNCKAKIKPESRNDADPAKLTPTNNDLEAIQFLKENITPWPKVESVWIDTFNIRQQKITQMKNISDLLEEFPLFSNKDYGHILIQIDFKMKFLKNDIHNNFKNSWDTYSKIILSEAFKKTGLQDFNVKKLTGNKDLIDIRAFSGIHHLLPPAQIAIYDIESDKILLNSRNKIQQKNAGGSQGPSDQGSSKPKNPPRRPTIIDSKISTLLIVDHGQNVKSEIRRYANSQFQKKIPFHPIMAVYLTKEKEPSKFYVYVDGIILESKNFKTNIDTYMMIFYVLNLEFPQEGAKACEFLADLFFNFPSADAKIRTLVKDIKKKAKKEEEERKNEKEKRKEEMTKEQ